MDRLRDTFVMGVRQTNSFLEKGTWVLVSLLVVLSIVSVWTAPRAIGLQSKHFFSEISSLATK